MSDEGHPSSLEVVGDSDSKVRKTKKKKLLKKGIIYVSTIPPFMNVTKITEIMSQYGEVGRVFLQPAKSKKPGNKPSKHFTEGWVEFLSKRVAKEVAANLNNTMIGGRKKSRYYDYIWNLKYLPRFKWVHLNERLEYERAVLKQRLRTEIEQAKRESSHFAHTIELSEKLKKRKVKTQEPVTSEKIQRFDTFKQRKTEEEILKKKKQVKPDRTEFLQNLFVK
ncbi:Activator of basal transcription 1 [Homalodisca vitripennis]|nr:Activator of basal transcription 1 [Homalodisca vitripennis]